MDRGNQNRQYEFKAEEPEPGNAPLKNYLATQSNQRSGQIRKGNQPFDRRNPNPQQIKNNFQNLQQPNQRQANSGFFPVNQFQRVEENPRPRIQQMAQSNSNQHSHFEMVYHPPEGNQFQQVAPPSYSQRDGAIRLKKTIILPNSSSDDQISNIHSQQHSYGHGQGQSQIHAQASYDSVIVQPNIMSHPGATDAQRRAENGSQNRQSQIHAQASYDDSVIVEPNTMSNPRATDARRRVENGRQNRRRSISQEDDDIQADDQPIRRGQADYERGQRLLEARRKRQVLQQEKERQQNEPQEQAIRPHSKYVNLKELENFLKGQNACQQIDGHFRRFFKNYGDLRQALDNNNQRSSYFFQTVMDVLLCLCEAPNIQEYRDHIYEIFNSRQFQERLGEQLKTLIQEIFSQQPRRCEYILGDLFFIYEKITPLGLDDINLHMDKIEVCIMALKRAQSANQKAAQLENQFKQIKELQQTLILQKLQEEAKLAEEARKRREFQIIENIQIDYQDCPSEPVKEEFQGDLEQDRAAPIFGQIMQVLQSQPYPSVDLYLNNNFYILREDYLREFRQAIHSMQKYTVHSLTKSVIQNIFIYYDIEVLDLQIGSQGIEFKLRMTAYDQRQRRVDWLKTSRLMTGSLLALVTEDVRHLIFLTVKHRQISRREEVNNRITILCQQTGSKFLDQLHAMNQILMSTKSLFVLENKVYFETYIHYLNCIKSLEPKSFPFQDQIVKSKPGSCKPKYLEAILERQRTVLYNINLKFNLHENNRINQGNPMQVDILAENWPSYMKESLDDTQLKAIQLMLREGIALVQGPPGTGKTFCGALGVRILLENSNRWTQQDHRYPYQQLNKPILIVCYTNHALDQFLNHILTFLDKSMIVRVGGRCKDQNLQDCMLQKLKNGVKCKRRFPYQDYYNKRDFIESKIHRMFNQEDNVHYKDCIRHWPDLVNKIVNEYLEYEDLLLEKPLCDESRKKITHLWLDSKKPREEDFRSILSSEINSGNRQVREPERKQAWRAALRIVQEQIAPPMLDPHFYQQIQENQYDNVDENNLIDSEDEEDRRLAGNADSDEEGNNDRMSEDKLKAAKEKIMRRSGYDPEKFEAVKAKIEAGTRVWDLRSFEREIIAKFIFLKKYLELRKQYEEEIKEFQEMHQELQNIYMERDISILQQKKIIGVTVTGCAKYAQFLSQLKFSIMLIEEAAEVLEAHTAAILTENIEHLILIGDHLQLRPKLESYYLETRYQTNISLFERLINNKVPYVTLSCQRRMKSEFADFIRLIYGPEYKDHECIQTERNPLAVAGMESSLLFFNHKALETNDRASSSKSNDFEAQMIVRLIMHLLRNQLDQKKITVLALYQKQALKLKVMLEDAMLRAVRVQTVDNYQGEENDIIILSLVRSNMQGKIGFIGIDNRICVALSRARIGLYVFGNFTFIESVIKADLMHNKNRPRYSDLWLKIISKAKEKKVLKDSIIVECASHRDKVEIKEIQDWRLVPNGGCRRDCNIRLTCGHVCKLKCHIGTHLRSDCRERCEQILSCGHQCTDLCRKDCPRCSQKVEINLNCGHKALVMCSEKERRLKCNQKCLKELQCGHPCNLLCYEDCSKAICSEPVEVHRQQCDHIIQVPCMYSKSPAKLLCSHPCEAQLPCGHKCSGSCGICLGDLHKPCEALCNRVLLCGHTCKRNCGQPCVRCEEPCQYQCCQAVCQKKCGDECIQCLVRCPSMCQHTQCTKKCFEECDRQPCNISCEEELECGCKCLGLCGEECPRLCRNKDHSLYQAEVFEVLFGDEDEPNSKFYKLECPGGHIFEVNGLDTYFRKIFEDSQMGFLRCPRCKGLVCRSNRYRSYTRAIQRGMNVIKRKEQELNEVSEDSLDELLTDVLKVQHELKNKGLKDQDEFLLNIQQYLKRQINKVENIQTCDLVNYQYVCLKNQVNLYIQALELGLDKFDNQEFERQKYILRKDYLLNLDFMSYSNNKHWVLIEQKLKTLRLYQQIVKQFVSNKQRDLLELVYKIEDSNFMLTPLQYQEFLTTIRNLSQLSIEEIRQIAMAVKDSGGPGHWFKCPNGHYFAIGDCGGAMETSKCPDCGAKIGGANHQLVQGNNHAGEIDGSNNPAWSNQANMAAGQLQQFF